MIVKSESYITQEKVDNCLPIDYIKGRQLPTYIHDRWKEHDRTGIRERKREREGSMEKWVKLSEAEWKVMSLLWEKAPQTMMQLTSHFKNTTGWTKHTVMSFLKRMEEKGAVYYEEGGRAKLYYPKIERKEAVLQETEDFLDKVFDGRMGLMLNTMVEQQALSKEELAELYEILRKAEERSGEGGDSL